MARPRDPGLLYFNLDVDFFSDQKVRIVMLRFGADGVTIWLYLLCQIYRAGYYIHWTEDTAYIAANDLNMSVEKVQQVLKFLLERSLLDNKLFQSDTILTSAGIQRRYQEGVKLKASKNPIEIKNYWILPEEETQPWLKVAHFNHYSENNRHYSENNRHYSENNGLKEKKGKEKKGKEYIDAQTQGEKPDLNPSGDQLYRRVIEYLNEKCGTAYKASSKATQRLIHARMSDGFDLEDFKYVIDIQASEWKGTNMEGYLRPETLFGTKFEGYRNKKRHTSHGSGHHVSGSGRRVLTAEDYAAQENTPDDIFKNWGNT